MKAKRENKGHIDEVCWLFSMPTPTPEQFKRYDELLYEEGWNSLGIEDLDEEEKDVLWEDLQIRLDSESPTDWYEYGDEHQGIEGDDGDILVLTDKTNWYLVKADELPCGFWTMFGSDAERTLWVKGYFNEHADELTLVA